MSPFVVVMWTIGPPEPTVPLSVSPFSLLRVVSAKSVSILPSLVFACIGEARLFRQRRVTQPSRSSSVMLPSAGAAVRLIAPIPVGHGNITGDPLQA